MSDQENLPISKSQRKRDMIALQKLGETLTSLPLQELISLKLPENLLRAIEEAKKIKSHEGKRRQLQFIGKLMRQIEDTNYIQDYLDAMQMKSNSSKAKFHLAEQWRDKLIDEGQPAIKLFIQEFPRAEFQYLNQVIRQIKKDLQTEKNSGNKKKLFLYIKKIILEQTT